MDSYKTDWYHIVSLVRLLHVAQISQSKVVSFFEVLLIHFTAVHQTAATGRKEGNSYSIRSSEVYCKGQVKMATVEKDDRHSVSSLLFDFLGYTSMHGAGRTVASRHWLRKIFWIISIMATMAFLSWQVYTLYRLYQDRPLSTHIKIEHDTVKLKSIFIFYLLFFGGRYATR